MSRLLDRVRLRRLWEQALAEDGADRDVTSMSSVSDAEQATARVMARQAGTFAGAVMFDLLSEAYPARLTITERATDGASLTPGDLLAEIHGPTRSLLGIERTLLNFLQRLCGIATLTRRYVEAIEGSGAKIYDTRKTIPGWRQLDKYGVRCGGGNNHRMGLHDAILIKDNHIADVPVARLAGRLMDILTEASALDPPPHFIEVEVDTLEQFDEVLKVVGVDVVLLDNFTPQQMRDAVERRDTLGLKGKVRLEASGGVDLSTVKAIAATGVDRIAVGAITHSAPALDINMEVESI